MAKIAVLVPRQEMQVMAEQLVGSYKNLTPVCLEFVKTMDAARRAAELEAEGCDLIMARGFQATIIKQAVQLPVVNIIITTQELGILALQLKNELGVMHPKIGLIGFENMFSDTARFEDLFDVEIVRYTLPETETRDTQKKLADFVSQAEREGCHAVLGGDVVCAQAEAQGMPYRFFASTLESMRNAFAMAERMAYAIDLEKQSSSEMNTMLDFTFSGIMQIDAGGIIRRGNRVLYNLLGLQPSELLERPIQEVLPQIRSDLLARVLQEGDESYASLLPIEDRAVVVNAAPILIENRICGAILTFQESNRITQINSELRAELYQRGFVARYRFDRIPVQDAEMKKLISRARRVARFTAPILLKGEHGTGTTVMAQCLHNESLVSTNAFVDVDCAAFPSEVLDTMLFGNYSTRADSPAGLAETAQNGTLFLSHIDSLSMELQYKVLQLLRGKLLRNGASRPVSSEVRIIASTTNNLIAAVERDEFRNDLYYELSVISLELPPLRKRRDDVLPWVNFYLEQAQNQHKRYVSLTKGAEEYLKSYDWPGNLDQLRGICERTVLTAERRTVDEVFLRRELEQLAPRIDAETQQVVVVKDPKALEIAELLKKHGGDRQKVADELGVSKTTLWRYMKKYGIGQDFSC